MNRFWLLYITIKHLLTKAHPDWQLAHPVNCTCPVVFCDIWFQLNAFRTSPSFFLFLFLFFFLFIIIIELGDANYSGPPTLSEGHPSTTFCLRHCVIQAVHSLLYIVAKCHFFSVVTWKYIIKYLQKCEGCTHFCEILCIQVLVI